MARDAKPLLDEVERMQRRMDRLFEEMMPAVRWMPVHQRKTWRPPTDVYETDQCIVVKVEVAGMAEGDFTISLADHVLTITGTRLDPVSKLAYQQLEISYGDFRTEVYLPWNVDSEEIEAAYRDGFLRVVLPKARSKKICVMEITRG
ncbi:MAG: Hsp20/alpha crystallin family protein [Chloroflexota bacterium]|nr:Hsp20/alpha crystallin family protein [Chloroflexota bacterium]